MENKIKKKLRDPKEVRRRVINEVIEQVLAENHAEIVRRTQVRLEEIAKQVESESSGNI